MFVLVEMNMAIYDQLGLQCRMSFIFKIIDEIVPIL